MKFDKWLLEKWKESIVINNKINNSNIIYEKFHLLFNKFSILHNDILLFGEYKKNIKNVLLIGGAHGTENSSPWALYDFFKLNIEYNLNFCCIPILNVESFNTGFRDISKDDDLTILNNLNYLQKFDYIISLHEDHLSQYDSYYFYAFIDENKLEEICSLKKSIENKMLSYDKRLKYNTEYEGIFLNKYSGFAEEKLKTDTNILIRTEICGNQDFNDKKNNNLKILKVFLNYFNRYVK